MSTMYDKIKVKLETFPNFRERRFRKNRLAILALRELEYEYKIKEDIPLTLEQLVEFASKYDNYRHEYDRVQKECEILRGSDYSDGKILAEEKMLEFEYSPNFHNDIKKLNTLL